MSETMQISAVKAKDYRGCREFQCEPGARALVLLGGKNGAGKTSALNSLEWGLLGAEAGPAEVVRHGAEAAEVTITLDGGRYTVTRRETSGGTRSLVVRGPDGGKLDKPQAVLDRLIGARFLDPVAFASMKPKDQREALLRVVPIGIDLAQNARERQVAYDERTDCGKLGNAASGALSEMPAATEPPPIPDEAEVSVSALTGRLAEMQAQADAKAAKRREFEDAHRAHARLAQEVLRLAERATAIEREQVDADAELDREIQSLRDRHAQAKGRRSETLASVRGGQRVREGEAAVADAKAAALAAEADAMPAVDTTAIREQIATAEDTNRAIRARRATAEAAHRDAETLRKRREEGEVKVKTLHKEYAAYTAKIAALDKARADALAAAPMPLPGLAVSEDGLVLGGVPFAQISDGERIKASVAIAMALQPGLRDIIIRDGALLDEDNLAGIAAQAETAGYRLWVERVGTGDAGALVFVDGQVAP